MLIRQQPAEALQAANAVVALRPTDRRARLLQAWSLASTGEAVKARAILDQLIKESPKDTDARMQLGLLALKQGELSRGRRYAGRVRRVATKVAIPAWSPVWRLPTWVCTSTPKLRKL